MTRIAPILPLPGDSSLAQCGFFYIASASSKQAMRKKMFKPSPALSDQRGAFLPPICALLMP